MKYILMLTLLTTFTKADISTIIAPESKVEKLGTDMKFTEGPVWIPEKKMIVFSDIPNSKLMQWTKENGLLEFRNVEQ